MTNRKSITGVGKTHCSRTVSALAKPLYMMQDTVLQLFWLHDWKSIWPIKHCATRDLYFPAMVKFGAGGLTS